MTDNFAIEISGLRKCYGKRWAVNGLDLCVSRGEIFGFLGPNGAGKSTTIRILMGLLRHNGGTVRMLGRTAGTVHSRSGGRVGALVEEPAFYDYLSGRMNLEILTALSGPVDKKRIEHVLEMVGMRDRAKDRVRTYSHGMKQRLGIAQALIPRPELLILDEPASGLDPQGLVEVRDLLQRVNSEEGVTVFLSSHLLHEVEALCTDAAIVNKGQVIRRDKVSALLSQPETAVRIIVEDPQAAFTILQEQTIARTIEITEDGLRVVCAPENIADINTVLVNAGLRVNELARERLSLEELYLQMMQ